MTDRRRIVSPQRQRNALISASQLRPARTQENVEHFTWPDHKSSHDRRMRKKRSSALLQEARKSKLIVKGQYLVSELSDTNDSIGSMKFQCSHCKALKYCREVPSLCCNMGKLKHIKPLRRPTPEIERLIHGITDESKAELSIIVSQCQAYRLINLIRSIGHMLSFDDMYK